MSEFQEISPQQAWEMVQQQNAIILDIRDAMRFQYSHPKGAFHLTNQSYLDFERQYEDEQPILVICYHGVSSRNTAAFLVEQGYEQVYSIKGGFQAWQQQELPIESLHPENPQTEI